MVASLAEQFGHGQLDVFQYILRHVRMLLHSQNAAAERGTRLSRVVS